MIVTHQVILSTGSPCSGCFDWTSNYATTINVSVVFERQSWFWIDLALGRGSIIDVIEILVSKLLASFLHEYTDCINRPIVLIHLPVYFPLYRVLISPSAVLTLFISSLTLATCNCFPILFTFILKFILFGFLLVFKMLFKVYQLSLEAWVGKDDWSLPSHIGHGIEHSHGVFRHQVSYHTGWTPGNTCKTIVHQHY